MAYSLEGLLLEVCDCNIACSCRLGGDTDTGSCFSVVDYHVDRGTANGTEVSGCTMGKGHSKFKASRR